MNRRGFLAALPAASFALAQSPAPEIAGRWLGTLATSGGKLRLAMEISKTSDGLYTGTATSLDQGNARFRIDTIKLDGAAVHMEMKAVSAVYEATLDRASAKLSGAWSQGGPSLRLDFRRTAPAPVASAAATASPGYPMGLPLAAEVLAPPAPFPARGRMHLVYELHITNLDLSANHVLLKRLEALDGATTIGSWEGSDLIGILVRLGGTVADPRELDAGRSAIAFLWVTADDAGKAPLTLRHRLTVGDSTIETAAVPVSRVKPMVLSAPLPGSGWVAGNGPGNNSIHRRALVPLDGRIRAPERFAIDWIKTGAGGRSFEGSESNNKSYFAYGTEVLAVSDATVAAIKDGIPENKPGPTSRAVPITLETVGGNHIILDLGGGQYALYAHLQPGSLRVKIGDRVKRGAPMALLGNSGNSTEPHLHFQVTDGNSLLGAEGLPYVLDSWHNELPLQDDRVSF